MKEFELKVINKENGELFNYHSFKTVGKVEILSEKGFCQNPHHIGG